LLYFTLWSCNFEQRRITSPERITEKYELDKEFKYPHCHNFKFPEPSLSLLSKNGYKYIQRELSWKNDSLERQKEEDENFTHRKKIKNIKNMEFLNQNRPNNFREFYLHFPKREYLNKKQIFKYNFDNKKIVNLSPHFHHCKKKGSEFSVLCRSII